MARQAVQMANSRSAVRHFFNGVYCGGSPRIEKTIRTFRVPTPGHCRCNSDCCSRSGFPRAAFDSIRLWHLHQPIPFTSVFHIRPFAMRRDDSFRTKLRLRDFHFVSFRVLEISTRTFDRSRRSTDRSGRSHCVFADRGNLDRSPGI